jgi:thymidylate synthase ThyX
MLPSSARTEDCGLRIADCGLDQTASAKSQSEIRNPKSAIGDVRLLNATSRPYENAVATAMTCYSSKMVTADDVSRDEKSAARRDRVAERTFHAGHNTTLQHNAFQFALYGVSRHFIWSFLHDHPFYNSEQVSQRYVRVRPDRVFVPPLSDRGAEKFLEISRDASETYARLTELLHPVAERAYAEVYPGRRARMGETGVGSAAGLVAEKWQKDIQKKAQEVARYVLPVATLAHLHHTISGLTLHRYRRVSETVECSSEAKLLIDAMCAEVEKHDPLFFRVAKDPMPLEETAEFRLMSALGARAAGGGTDAESSPARQDIASAGGADIAGGERAAYNDLESDRWIREFDAELDGRTAILTDGTSDPERTLARAIRNVLTVSEESMPDDAAIRWALDPSRNPMLGDTLNVTAHGKLTHALVHAHFTFRKKLSLTADAQDQRHRTVPGSRPLLARQFRAASPDYITPTLLRGAGAAEDAYHAFMKRLWQGMRELLESGEPIDSVLYLLPNAFPVRFEESGDLAGLRHKWAMRLCYNAQEEIWKASCDEVEALRAKHPLLGRWMLPPCGHRLLAGATPFCPEGAGYCGVPVWKLDLEDYRRVI